MPTVKVLKADGGQSGTIDLNDVIFAAQINEPIMHEVVVAHLANNRQGTQSALTRAEVRGGGIKPFRQKGTGRARQGSSRSPINEGGGVVFAPKPRSYKTKTNKKVRRNALLSALSSKVENDDIIIVEELKLKAPKTKEMIKILDNLNAKNALIVTAGKDEIVVRAAGNIPDVETIPAEILNVYDILNHEKLILTKDAVAKIEEVYA